AAVNNMVRSVLCLLTVALAFVPLKTGLCPSPGDYGICDHACSSDQDCKGDDKCCPTTCGTICEPPVINKPGVCPSVKSGVQIYICVSQCISGSDCNGNLKCGSNGCGHTCLEPVINKPGVCPSVKSGVQIYICVSQCISGSDCNGNLKCGSNGCGHTCLEPVISKTLFS
uniref:WAP domain-containing protein n=1 Tax=Periophthalmus magnuspinnatus TaxID=409849 RepID=A0A3B3ZGR4_9GOBI